nr:auxin-responsive protein SAUR36-like [Ipomoea batatas]
MGFVKRNVGFIRVGPAEEEASVPPAGHLAVYVGEAEGATCRVVVPVFYFNHPLFANLLREAETVYGFDHPGGIQIPCRISEFENDVGSVFWAKQMYPDAVDARIQVLSVQHCIGYHLQEFSLARCIVSHPLKIGVSLVNDALRCKANLVSGEVDGGGVESLVQIDLLRFDNVPASILHHRWNTYLSSIQATLYKSPRHVMYSGGGAGSDPGQYVPQLLSSAFEAVVT